MLGLTHDQLACERPTLRSPLKQWNNPVWAESEAEPDLPYTRDFEKPLGHLTFVLSDSHGNHAHVACDVRHPGDSSPISWTVNPHSTGELSANVSLATVLECEIDRETLQNLWQLVAYYYESPAILERGQQRGNTSRVTYQYVQAVNKNSPYFTELKGHLAAEPSWLLQPRVTLRLNRKQTTTKKLVMDFTTLIINKKIDSYSEHDGDTAHSWALIRTGSKEQIHTALEGSKVSLMCSVNTPDSGLNVEWILPDLSVAEHPTDMRERFENGHLIISNSTLSDSGLYHCMVRTKVGVDLMPVRLTIKERLLSPTAFNGQKVVAEKGKLVSLPCDVTSVQPSQTIWYLPKNQILLPTQQTRRAEVLANGTLLIRRLTQEDAGEYSCLASNLYGVDMLSHMVEVTEKTASDKVKAETERERQILAVSVEEEEGSGRDYQEIIRPSATQFPKKVGTKHKNPGGFSKRLRIKDSKRKPNKSVKELDPSRWAEMLAKAKAKPSVALPTELSLEEPSTVTVQTSTFRLTSTASTTVVASTSSLLHSSTSVDISTTYFPIDSRAKTKNYAKHSETLENSLLQPFPPRNTDPSLHHVEKTKSITDSPVAETPQPVDQNFGGGRKSHSLRPGQANRRRFPYRRRKPPMRGVHPHLNPLYPLPKILQTTVSPTTTTPKTATIPTTTTTSTTPVATTFENQISSSEYLTNEDEGKYYEEHNYKDGDSLETNKDFKSENLNKALGVEKHPTVGESPGRHNFPNPNTIVTTKVDSAPDPTLRTAVERTHIEEKDKDTADLEKSQIIPTKERDRHNKDLAGDREVKTAMEWQEKEKLHKEGSERITEKSQKEFVTERYPTWDRIRLTQNGSRPNTQNLVEQNVPTHARISTSKVITLHSPTFGTREEDTPKQDKDINKPGAKPEVQRFPIMEPVHPWLHQNHQSTRTSKERNTGKPTEVNPGRHSQPSRVPPTSHWPAHHHHYHSYNPIWPRQRSFPNPPRKGKKNFKYHKAERNHTLLMYNLVLFPDPGTHTLPTHRPWPLPHPWAHSPVVTNRPEITAETVKPTPTLSGSTGNSRFTLSDLHHQNHHVDGRTQTRDQQFLLRLRNRYRQV